MEIEADSGFQPRKRLLLVEDDAALARDVARCFVLVGYSVRIAATLAQAEAASADGLFDCGLFDVALQPEDGVALAKHLIASGYVRSAVLFNTAPGGVSEDPLGAGRSAHFDQLRFMVSLACG
jgi:DNA-binding response OmpR family regulator